MNNDPFCGGRKLPLVEDFYTIQGEGFHAGKPAYFIRLGGCDVGCRWCDAKMTWNPRLYPPVPGWAPRVTLEEGYRRLLGREVQTC